jgi:HSP20 family molecular chaperone IbpA
MLNYINKPHTLGVQKQTKMTQLQRWAMDPFDIVWKNFFDVNSNFNTIQHKINYPVDIYETDNGLRFELAVVGLNKEELDIQVDGDTLRIQHENQLEDSERVYLQRGIARRSFDLAWKIAAKYDLAKLIASMDKGLLIIDISYAESKAPKKVTIK